MLIKKVRVVGSGMMGVEIALCFANAGYDVVMSDAIICERLYYEKRCYEKLFAK